MATSQGQDIILCQLCSNPVEHHCNICHVELCFLCVSKHLTDKSKRHEVVEFINRKEGPVLPECKYHDKTHCEMYCNDCHEPTCVLCVTTTHKKHDITDIKSIVENLKRRIAADVEELENTIFPKYKKIGIDNSSTEFDKVMNAIQDQEDNICKAVKEIGTRLKAEVAKQKKEFEQKIKKVCFSITKEEKQLKTIIENNKGILESKDAKKILTYQTKNESFRRGPKQVQISYPTFLSGNVNQNQLRKMFGSLQRSNKLLLDGKRGTQKLMSNPVFVSTIQTPYAKQAKLWRVLYEGVGKIWISGNDSKIYQIDQMGSILKTINPTSKVCSLSLSDGKQLIFSAFWPDTKVYKYDGDALRTLIDLRQWCPCGLCHSANGDLLVSMRSVDKTQSRVVRYSGTTETMAIQNDSQKTPLFSVDTQYLLLLTENGNGDICVSDYAAEAVVVVNVSGELQFEYRGPPSLNPCFKAFKPARITADVNQHIIINDLLNNILHVIGRDGSFLRYIEYPCNGGLSIDTDHNLVLGEEKSGIIRIIKYLD